MPTAQINPSPQLPSKIRHNPFHEGMSYQIKRHGRREKKNQKVTYFGIPEVRKWITRTNLDNLMIASANGRWCAFEVIPRQIVAPKRQRRRRSTWDQRNQEIGNEWQSGNKPFSLFCFRVSDFSFFPRGKLGARGGRLPSLPNKTAGGINPRKGRDVSHTCIWLSVQLP